VSHPSHVPLPSRVRTRLSAPLHPPEPPPQASAGCSTAQLGVGPCSISPASREPDALWCTELGGSGAQGFLVTLACPCLPLHLSMRALRDVALAVPTHPLKVTKTNVFFLLSKAVWKPAEIKKVFPSLKTRGVAELLHSQDLPLQSYGCPPKKLRRRLYSGKMRSLSSISPARSTTLVFRSPCSCKAALFIPNQPASPRTAVNYTG